MTTYLIVGQGVYLRHLAGVLVRSSERQEVEGIMKITAWKAKVNNDGKDTHATTWRQETWIDQRWEGRCKVRPRFVPDGRQSCGFWIVNAAQTIPGSRKLECRSAPGSSDDGAVAASHSLHPTNTGHCPMSRLLPPHR